MIVIESESMVPPGGAFVSRHPISGVEFRAHTVDGVWNKYNAHCIGNGYPEISRQEMVENICANTKANICTDSDVPTVVQMATNFFNSIADWATSGFQISKELAQQRVSICNECPHWGGPTGGSYLSGRCGKCGCSGVKLLLSGQKCPIGKW